MGRWTIDRLTPAAHVTASTIATNAPDSLNSQLDRPNERVGRTIAAIDATKQSHDRVAPCDRMLRLPLRGRKPRRIDRSTERVDEGKNRANLRKHGVTFEEAGRLFVVWTERDEEEIRIISARWATDRERELFAEYLRRTK
jgi:hypothetical protein